MTDELVSFPYLQYLRKRKYIKYCKISTIYFWQALHQWGKR